MPNHPKEAATTTFAAEAARANQRRQREHRIATPRDGLSKVPRLVGRDKASVAVGMLLEVVGGPVTSGAG